MQLFGGVGWWANRAGAILVFWVGVPGWGNFHFSGGGTRAGAILVFSGGEPRLVQFWFFGWGWAGEKFD